MMMIVSLVEQV